MKKNIFIIRLFSSFLVIATLLHLSACTKTDETTEGTSTRGKVLTETLKATYTVQQLKDELSSISPLIPLALPVSREVEVYQITYQTIDPKNNIVTASGVIAIPKTTDSNEAFPMVSYQHGTVAEKSDAPSVNGMEHVIPYALAGDGFIGIAPDYLGLGLGSGNHYYIHAQSEATATIDMLRATRNFCKTHNIKYNDKLFLVGYSQGGHATMATLKYIEKDYNKEFKVTACAPMAGPYDLSGTMAEFMLREEPYSVPMYLPYIVMTYHRANDLYNSPSDFFKPPYDQTLPPLFDGYHSTGEIDAAMPASQIPIEVLKPEVVQSFKINPEHPLRKLLKENNTYDFLPKTPVRLYHCPHDEQVSYQNSIIAYDYFKANGLENVSFVTPADLPHPDCALPSLLDCKQWFDTFR